MTDRRSSAAEAQPLSRVVGPLQAALGVLLCVSIGLLVSQLVDTAKTDAAYERRLNGSDTHLALVIASVRDSVSLASAARQWMQLEVPRREVQIHRALVQHRLSTLGADGRSAADLSGSDYRRALAQFDAAYSTAPTGVLGADQQDAWVARLEPPLADLDRASAHLLTRYQLGVDDGLRNAAIEHRDNMAAQVARLLITLAIAALLGLSIWYRIRLNYRTARRVIEQDRADLERTTAQLSRMTDFEAEQTNVLEQIIAGADLMVVLDTIASLASEYTGGRPFRVTVDARSASAGSERVGSELVEADPSALTVEACWEFTPLGGTQRVGRVELLKLEDATISDAAAGTSDRYTVAATTAEIREIGQRCADLALIAANGHWAREQLILQASSDPLTGLHNRNQLQRRASHAFARRAAGSQQVALVFCDLDRFKLVNDTLGHKAGDQLLVHVGRWMRRTIDTCAFNTGTGPVTTTLARLGGDEFVVLLEANDALAAAVMLSARLQELSAQAVILEGVETFVDLSIGVALAGPEVTTPEQLLRNADIAMYHAKLSGEHAPVLYGTELEPDIATQLRTDTELRLALDRAEFRLFLQPIVSIDRRTAIGHEALVRWDHPTRGLLGPDTFLHRVEEIGLIGRLDTWVRREAFAWLAEALADGVDPSENAFVDLGQHGNVLDRLRRSGVLIAMDDFGTGYSSLVQIQRLPIDIVKLDQGLIRGVGEPGSRARGVLSGLLEVVRSLGLTLVVEGVETESERDVLMGLGCTFAQGYLFGRPIPAVDAHEGLRSVTAPT